MCEDSPEVDHVNLMIQVLFPDGDGIFQDDNTPIYTARVVKNCMKSTEVI